MASFSCASSKGMNKVLSDLTGCILAFTTHCVSFNVRPIKKVVAEVEFCLQLCLGCSQYY